MPLTDMCRLCSSKDNLVWVFDKRFENTDNMKYMTLITTGVEISTTDAVSQSICEKCCHIIIKMFEFRKKSLENDTQLKEKLKSLNNEDSTQVQIKEEILDIPEETKKDAHKLSIIIHPSVKELYDLYPHIKLQRICLTTNVKPFVVMKMGKVESYYKERNLDFEEHCRLAMKSRTTARKRTLASKRTIYESPPCSISGQIIQPEVDDVEEGVLRPIKIKIIPKISAKENVTEETKGIFRITETESDVQTSEKTAPCHRKRKYSDTKELPAKENVGLKEPDHSMTLTDVQTSEKTAPCHRKRKYSDTKELPAKENEGFKEPDHSMTLLEGSKSLSYVSNVTLPLYICNICDAVRNNPKDLKKHRNKHLRCQFCRSTFRSLENKAQHIENGCLIKNAMNNIPCVKLLKVETSIDIVKTYPKAFANFSPATNIENSDCCEILSSESEAEFAEPSLKPVEHITAKNTMDVIEILSDDDNIPTNLYNSTLQGDPSPTKIPKLTPSIKPDVKIKNNQFTDSISSNSNEMLILKNLLTGFKPLTEKSVQTHTLDQHSIEVDNHGQTALLTNMKQNLHFFQVPVVIKEGPFNVSYRHLDRPMSKNLQLWNDLIPVDIKRNTELTTVKQATGNIIKSVSRSVEAKESQPTAVIVSNPIIEDESRINVGTSHIAFEDSSINTCTRTSYDKSSNNLPHSDSTIVSITKPDSSTHNHISVVESSTASIKLTDSSITNQSTSVAEDRTTSVIQWKPPLVTSSRSDSSLQDIARPKSTIDCRTYSISEKLRILHTENHMTVTFEDTSTDKHLVNPPVVPTPVSLPSYLIQPNTSVYNVPDAVRSVPPTTTFLKQPETSLSGTCKYPDEVTNRKSREPLATDQSGKTSSTLCNTKRQSINASLNNNTVTGNVCTPTTSMSYHWPPGVYKPVNSKNMLGVSSNSFTAGHSNDPIVVDKSKKIINRPTYFPPNISQPVPLSYSTTVIGSSVSYATSQSSNSIKYVPVRSKIDARRSSLPIQTLKTVPPPPYSVAVASISNNNYYTLPHQITNKISDGGNSFFNTTNAVKLPQHFSDSRKPSVDNKSVTSNTVAKSSLNISHVPTVTTFAQMQPISCSVATPLFGHIRVKNMQELI
ncbi:uncharacterized protein LOC108913355 isoform X2 [Anoplophora glabripennis]|uniref:uncharacterized protein LOC108913355 isoform X2 n=1 Tax=Anoplophora glabripennis TaxID=217634 RepID=UPI000874334C|nr:uncharacterized protein LOC108913355 isoform X2 [Anoplophora glabripennis]